MNANKFVFTFGSIGTQWEIETHKEMDHGLKQRILKRVNQYETTYSRFRQDSLVTRMATAPEGGYFEFPDDSIALFALYDKLYTASGGAIDPLVGRDLELLGYDRTYSFTPVPEHYQEKVQDRVSWPKDVIRHGASLVTHRQLVIDVGAVGKGYLVDIVSDILIEEGFTDFIVDGSGDIRHSGESWIQVGLEHPFDSSLVIGVVNLKNRALCASAVIRRAWGEGLHHIIDARTGVPVRDVVATWVIAEDTATADGLATALFFTRTEYLAEVFRFSYVRMFVDGRAEFSHNFDGELFY